LQPLVRLISNSPNAKDNIILFIPQPNLSPARINGVIYPYRHELLPDQRPGALDKDYTQLADLAFE
jgi:hypothetical protein